MAVDELKELLKNAKGYTSTHDSDNWEVQEFFDEFNKSEDLKEQLEHIDERYKDNEYIPYDEWIKLAKENGLYVLVAFNTGTLYYLQQNKPELRLVIFDGREKAVLELITFRPRYRH